jgi:hypothetical protein
MTENTPDEQAAQEATAQTHAEDNDDDRSVEDVTPTITKNNVQTVNVVPGITVEDNEPGMLPPCNSRWTIRKCFTDVPITHSSFAGANNETPRHKPQGDSGANCTATDREELLWQVKCFNKPVKVKTFDGDNDDAGEHRTVDAIGAGTLKMVDDSNHIMDCCCLLTPNSTGTAISLDKFMRDNRSIAKFLHQEGTMCGTGHMKFFDKDNRETHAVAMEERDGPWHASNSALMPPTLEGPTKRNVGTSSSPRTNKFTAPAQTTKQPNDTTSLDAKPDDNVDAEQFCQAHPTKTTEVTANETSAQNMGVFGGNMSKPTGRTRHVDMKQFVVLQWSEEDLISFTDCPCALLAADSLTKQTGRTKFYEHMDIVMGRRRPNFSPATQTDFAINLVSASNNLRQLHCADIVSIKVE